MEVQTRTSKFRTAGAVKLCPDMLQAWQREFLIALSSQQRTISVSAPVVTRHKTIQPSPTGPLIPLWTKAVKSSPSQRIRAIIDLGGRVVLLPSARHSSDCVVHYGVRDSVRTGLPRWVPRRQRLSPLCRGWSCEGFSRSLQPGNGQNVGFYAALAANGSASRFHVVPIC